MIESAIISSYDNQKIKNIRKLRKKKYRTIQNAYVIESIKLFKEAFQWKVPIKQIYFTRTCLEKNPDLGPILKDLNQNGVMIFEVQDNVFRHISEMKTPEGMLCVAEKQSRTISNPRYILILDHIQDPGNAGTIIRTADAAGFDTVLCSEHTIDIYDAKVIRSSMGSFFHIPVIQSQNLLSDIDRLKKEDVTLCGAAVEGEESFHCPIGKTEKIALILGNESHGMDEALKAQCDVLWRLPILGHAESLNVSVAAGILMYQISQNIFL